MYGECKAGAQINFPESGRGIGHVTPTIFGSTVGYPSDSLASCCLPRNATQSAVLLYGKSSVCLSVCDVDYDPTTSLSLKLGGSKCTPVICRNLIGHVSATGHPIHFTFGSRRVFGVGGSNGAISGSINSNPQIKPHGTDLSRVVSRRETTVPRDGANRTATTT